MSRSVYLGAGHAGGGAVREFSVVCGGAARQALRTLSEMSDRLQPHRERCAARLPERSHADGVNSALIALITPALVYKGDALVGDLSFGAPITGRVKSPGVRASRERNSIAAADDWRK